LAELTTLFRKYSLEKDKESFFPDLGMALEILFQLFKMSQKPPL